MSFLEDKVLAFMKANKGITVKTCQEKIGTTELRKIISNLKDKGYNIGDVWEDGANRYGIATRWKRYFLINESEVVCE